VGPARQPIEAELLGEPDGKVVRLQPKTQSRHDEVEVERAVADVVQALTELLQRPRVELQRRGDLLAREEIERLERSTREVCRMFFAERIHRGEEIGA